MRDNPWIVNYFVTQNNLLGDFLRFRWGVWSGGGFGILRFWRFAVFEFCFFVWKNFFWFNNKIKK
jgi:hypothetical protein